MFHGIKAGLVVFGMAMSAANSPASAFDHIVVLGNSLSDGGNGGRFSNGPNWVEQLAGRLNLQLRPSEHGGTNFAVGGARLDARSGPSSLRAQADRYLRKEKPAGRTLHIVFGGGNDLLGAIGSSSPSSAVEKAIASIKSIVADLSKHGATDILVPNLPDVGITPAVRTRGGQALAQARTISQRFNAALDEALAAYAQSPTMRLHRLDVYAMGERVRADPAQFGFSNVTRGCTRLSSCDGFLFWDDVHPTSAAHAHLADAAFRIISAQ
jgi:phospholipase/lecithinase/hemolysin